MTVRFSGERKQATMLVPVVACDDVLVGLDEGGLRVLGVGGTAVLERAALGCADLRWGEVGVFEVLRQHAMGVEEGAVDGDAVLLHARPGMGVGVHGGDGMLEFFVETDGFGGF